MLGSSAAVCAWREMGDGAGGDGGGGGGADGSAAVPRVRSAIADDGSATPARIMRTESKKKKYKEKKNRKEEVAVEHERMRNTSFYQKPD